MDSQPSTQSDTGHVIDKTPVSNPSSPGSLPPIAATPGRKKRKRSPTLIALVLFGLFLLVGGGILAFVYYTNIHQPISQLIRPVSRDKNEPASAATSASYDDIKGRSWNMLLLGSDNDGKYSFPAVLTQVMMVIHIDTVNNSVHMVSIPRDSWVYVPDVGGLHKIDQAFFLGSTQNNTFESGVRLARLTVEKDYGIPIDRYAWVGLSGFAKVIDTLGGVDIDILHPVVDDDYPNDTGTGSDPSDPYSYKRIYYAPGPQHLTGEQALEYVRSRHADLVGDIGRTFRQQQVLEALKKKLTVSSIIGNLPALFKDLTGSVYTDLSEQEMIEFANFGRALDSKSIQRLTLGPGDGDLDYGDLGTAYDPAYGNQSVIFPHCNNIQPVINSIFGLSGTTCHVLGP